MFDCAIQLMIEFAEWLPYLIPIILVLNLAADLLFGGNR